jgi:hypothetical protein
MITSRQPIGNKEDSHPVMVADPSLRKSQRALGTLGFPFPPQAAPDIVEEARQAGVGVVHISLRDCLTIFFIFVLVGFKIKIIPLKKALML